MLQPAIILVAVAAWLVAMASLIKAVRSHRPNSPRLASRMFLTGVLVFAGVIAGEFLVGGIIKAAALVEIRARLSGELESVTINDIPVGDADGLIAAVRDVHDTIAHHSHPTTRYRLSIKTSRGSLLLDLARDSQDPHEYWVFYPNFHSTNANEVGRVFTDAFDRL